MGWFGVSSLSLSFAESFMLCKEIGKVATNQIAVEPRVVLAQLYSSIKIKTMTDATSSW